MLAIVIFSIKNSFAAGNKLQNFEAAGFLLKEKTVSSLYTFFKSYDPVILKRVRRGDLIVSSPGEPSPDITYMIAKNRELISILGSRNSISYNTEEMNPADEMIVYAGIIELYTELKNDAQAPNPSPNFILPWSCIRQVLTETLSIGSLIEDYYALVRNGATWGSLRTVLWRTLKRYGGWTLAAGVIYDIITECL